MSNLSSLLRLTSNKFYKSSFNLFEKITLGAKVKSFGTTATVDKAWKLGMMNHVAVVTPDLDKSASFYRDTLGGDVSEKQELPEHGVTVVFVKLGDTKLELLEPLGEKSPVAAFLKKNALGGMHHICIETNDIEAAMKDLKAEGIRLLSDKPRIGAHGKPVVFMHPKDCNGVLVELEEYKD